MTLNYEVYHYPGSGKATCRGNRRWVVGSFKRYPKPAPVVGDLRIRLGVIRPEELAEMLDVSEDTLREWRRLKQGPDYVRTGKAVVYREKDVREWLERNVVLSNRINP